MTDRLSLRTEFVERFGGQPLLWRAPGRVNLIGEHTDYNGGLVMPVAIGFFTTVAGRARADRRIRVHSTNFAETVEFDATCLAAAPPARSRAAHWSDYVAGVARVLGLHGVELPGADLLIHGEVPLGSGLSSSASLEVATALALAETAGAAIEPRTLAALCTRAENEFVGTRCGVMDQFASACGRAGHALLLDCRSLDYRLLPLEARAGVADGAGAVRLVISNSMVRHQLAGSEYNRRREECELGVQHLARVAGDVATLRDVNMGMLLAHRAGMDEVIFRRCRHVVLENARVLAAAQALAEADLERFGARMWASHASLRDDYEVSCEELDLMVRLASEVEGVYGARMTGGGFGGCTVNLVRHDAVGRFGDVMSNRYFRATGHRPEIYVCASADGAARVTDD